MKQLPAQLEDNIERKYRTLEQVSPDQAQAFYEGAMEYLRRVANPQRHKITKLMLTEEQMIDSPKKI